MFAPSSASVGAHQGASMHCADGNPRLTSSARDKAISEAYPRLAVMTLSASFQADGFGIPTRTVAFPIFSLSVGQRCRRA